MNKQFLIVSYCLLSAVALSAQNPAKQLLWERVIFLRDSAASMAPDRKLEALLKLEAGFKNGGYRNDSACTLLLQRIGAAFYTLGDFDRAVNYTVQSINLIHSNPAKTITDKNCLLKDYSNLAIYFDSLNNSKGRKMATDSCIAIARNSGIVPEVYLIALVNKVKDLFYAGDYFLCFDYATSGELASRKYGGYNAGYYQTYFLTWIGNVIIASKDPDLYEQGEAVLLSALAINKNPGSEIFELGTIYELLAEVVAGKGNWDRALNYFRKALLYEQQNGTKIGCAQILNNIGYLYYFEHLNDYKKALITYKQALQAINENNATGELNNSEFTPILTNIAGVYEKRGMYDSAMYYYQLAFLKIGMGDGTKLPGNPEDPFFNTTNIKYLIELIVSKGDSFLKFYKSKKDRKYLTKAVKEYQLADRLLDKFKPNLNELDSKLFWRKKSRSLYEHAIEACYYQHKAEDAFYFFEKSRAVTLSDQLNEQTWLGQDDIFRLGQLKKKIAREENNLPAKHDSSFAKLYNILLNDKQKLHETEQEIRKRNPLYYQAFMDTSFITVRDVQQKILKDHKALIEIFTGDSAVYTIIIKEDKIDFDRIDKTDFDSSTKSFAAYVSNAQLLERAFPGFLNTSAHLYNLIFKNCFLPEGRIIISPDGHYFPFEALVTNSEGDNVTYFLEKYAVSYTYSARYLLTRFNESSQNNPHDFLGIAPIEYPHNAHVASLPQGESFLKGLQKYFRDGNLLLRDQASKSNFMENFSRYKIIQLYTHASANENIADPVIFFADSVLSLSDLVSDKKNAASLVVLSACETGTGKNYTGEGVFSFNRSFAVLGIPSSVTNLWAVDNVSTIKITNLFYKYLDEGLSLDVALQKAKLEFLHSSSQRTELPYYWSGIILAGKTNAIATKKPVPYVLVSIVAGLGLLLITSMILLYRTTHKAS